MNVYKQLFQFVPEKKPVAAAAILCSVLSSGFIMFAYFYIYRFLKTVILDGDYLAGEEMALKIMLFLISGSLIYLLAGYFSHILGFAFERSIRIKGIDGLLASSFKFLDTHPSGLIRKTIDDNAAMTHTAIAHFIPDFPKTVLTLLLSPALAFYIDLRIGLALSALTLAGIIFYLKMFSGTDFMLKYQNALNRLSSETVEYIRNMQVIKIFGTDLSSLKNMDNAISDYADTAYKYCLLCRTPYVLFQWIFIGAAALFIIPVALFLTQNDGLTKSSAVLLLMFTFLSGISFSSFNKIMYTSQHLFNANFAITALNKIYEEMKAESLTFGDNKINEEINEKINDKTKAALNENEISETQQHDHKAIEKELEETKPQKPKVSKKNIVFENVSFAYSDKNILENFSLKLEEGKTYALTGPSGGGKSTIAKLLSGFYTVNEGAIKIGGKNILSYSKETITENISFIFQNTKLFHKSIFDNVASAKKDATREEVLKALHLAGCDPIIAKLPQKENTIIGSKGIYLSGGETQRIAIARAILKDAPILIMDEASASIDPDNEYELLKAFKNLIKGKTVIMIAHRLTSLKNIDEILVIAKGKIIERGTEKELLAKDSEYRKLKKFYREANDWTVI